MSKLTTHFILFITVTGLVFPVFSPTKSSAQELSNVRLENGQVRRPPSQPRLIYRFEVPISPGPSWDILRKKIAGLTKEDLQEVAIRICSSKKLLSSLPSAVNDPFDIIKDIKSRFLSKSDEPQFLFLRSEDCISSKIPEMHATEVWAMGESSLLPPNIESYKYEQVKLLSLGFDPSVCSTAKRDYQKATLTLIKRLRTDLNSFGVIIGYYVQNERPDSELKKSMGKVKKLISKSGLSQTRYVISYEMWHADDSACSTKPVTKPSIFFITKAV